MRLKIVFDGVRIMNDRDPAMAPLRFREAERGVRAADNRMVLEVRVDVDDDGGERHRLPREGWYRPYSLYSLRVDTVIFDGEVDDRLEVTVHALPPDAGPEKAVSTYRRELTGDPASWVGSYGPREATGPEHLGFWQVYYRILAPEA